MVILRDDINGDFFLLEGRLIMTNPTTPPESTSDEGYVLREFSFSRRERTRVDESARELTRPCEK